MCSSDLEHVRSVWQHADAAIVGSSLVRRLATTDAAKAPECARAYAAELQKA